MKNFVLYPLLLLGIFWNVGKASEISSGFLCTEPGKIYAMEKGKWDKKQGQEFKALIDTYEMEKKIIKGKCINGLKEGVWEFYDKNKEIKNKITFKKDKVDGIATGYENKKIKFKASYKNDILEGITEEYYESGKLKTKVYFQNGVPEGITEGFYENGKVQYKSFYQKGKLEGVSKVYLENGTLMMDILFREGEAVESTCHIDNCDLENQE